MAMALMVSVAFGQTADKLMKKYKGMKGMQYENVTKRVQNMKESDDPKLYAASRGITQVEYLSGVMSESKAEKLQEGVGCPGRLQARVSREAQQQ